MVSEAHVTLADKDKRKGFFLPNTTSETEGWRQPTMKDKIHKTQDLLVNMYNFVQYPGEDFSILGKLTHMF